MLEDPAFSNPSQDGIWLAENLPITQKNLSILDVGCGTGVATLCAKQLFPDNNFTGIDIQKEAIKIAKQNSDINKYNINWIAGDILAKPFEENSFDIVFSNPPYHRIDKGFSSEKNNLAFATTEQMVDVWINNMLKITKPHGIVSIINHINNLPIIEKFAEKYQVDIIKLQTSATKPAKRILVNIYKGRQQSLNITQKSPE